MSSDQVGVIVLVLGRRVRRAGYGFRLRSSSSALAA
jgi:hypothetical protein